MRDLERAKTRLDEPDYYFGRAHRCDDIEFWIRDLEAKLPAGNPVADEAAWWHKKLHWAIGMPCDGTLEECKRAEAVNGDSDQRSTPQTGLPQKEVKP
jgi:hypothetical protein